MVPIYSFLRHSSSIPDFRGKNPARCHLTFMAEIRHRLPWVTWIVTIAWLISTCLHPCPFCLRLGDRALAPCVLAPCVYIQIQRQETSRRAMERKDVKCIRRRHKADKHDRHGKQRSKKANKGGVREGQM